MRTLGLLATALVTVAACAEAPTDGETSGGVGGGKADGEAVTVTFDDHWNETANGPLVAGESIRIDYDLDRLTTCRGTDMGSDVWGVTGFASFDGGEAKSFGLSQLSNHVAVPVKAALQIPAGAKHVAMWFQISNKWGCVAYDSNMDANYQFDIQSAASDDVVLAFDADWTEMQSGALHAGDTAIVQYDVLRLQTCAGSTHGNAAWGITGHYQVDGGAVHDFAASRADGPQLLSADAAITIPHGRDLALWFEATSIWGCHEYDSDYGANYHFAIN